MLNSTDIREVIAAAEYCEAMATRSAFTERDHWETKAQQYRRRADYLREKASQGMEIFKG